MILLTGAAGKTGKAILNSILPHGLRVRGLVRSTAQAEEIKNLGAKDVAIGDLRDEDSLTKVMEGVNTIYYICPNMSTDELEIGRKLIQVARQKGVRRIVYHSVFHPQIEAMPHHWQKMRMEECLFKSGLEYTVLQPCAYMQNILASWQSITEKGVYPIPYAAASRISIVDLKDVAAVAEIVLSQRGHNSAIYELAGPEPLSQNQVAEILSSNLGRSVEAFTLNRNEWAENSRKNGMDETAVATLLKMFEYYEKYGLEGNSNVLEYLLKRPATRFADFIQKYISSDQRKNR